MKIRHFNLILLVIFIVFAAANVVAITPESIAKRVLDRDDGTTQIAKVTLSSCRYIIKNKKMSCSETPRIKVMEGIRKDFGLNGQDSKTITILQKPIKEQGIGFLQYDYDEPGKEADQWMYFSALGKVKRIVSGNENEPKTGSFFGTEFNYEDMEARHLEDYTYKMAGETTYQGRPCWVIESIPTPKRARKSNYSKTRDWVDKERYVILKQILYNRQGKRIKRITYSQVEQVDGVWASRRWMIQNFVTLRITRMSMDRVTYNRPVEDKFLSLRTLTDRVFREQKLSQYRSYLR